MAQTWPERRLVEGRHRDAGGRFGWPLSQFPEGIGSFVKLGLEGGQVEGLAGCGWTICHGPKEAVEVLGRLSVVQDQIDELRVGIRGRMLFDDEHKGFSMCLGHVPGSSPNQKG